MPCDYLEDGAPTRQLNLPSAVIIDILQRLIPARYLTLSYPCLVLSFLNRKRCCNVCNNALMTTSLAAGPLHVILPPGDEFLLVLNLYVDGLLELFPALQCCRRCDDFAQRILRRLHGLWIGANCRSPRQCNFGLHAAIPACCFHWRMSSQPARRIRASTASNMRRPTAGSSSRQAAQ